MPREAPVPAHWRVQRNAPIGSWRREWLRYFLLNGRSNADYELLKVEHLRGR